MARGNASQGNAQALHRAGAGCSPKTHTKFRLLDKRILAQAQSRPTTSAEDLRSRVAERPQLPTRIRGHTTAFQTRTIQPTSNTAETRRRPPARPASRSSATPLSGAGKGSTGRDAIFSARLRRSLELGCRYGTAPPCPDPKRWPHGSRPL